MVTVADVLSLPCMASACPLVPYDDRCLKRQIDAVGVLDSYPHDGRYGEFSSFDLVLTSFGFAAGNQALFEQAILAILERKIAMLAIRKRGFTAVSDAAAALIRKTGIPVVFYEQEFYENIIVEVRTLLEEDRQQQGNSALIQKLVSPEMEAPAGVIYELFGSTAEFIQCAACLPTGDRCSLHATLGLLDSELQTFVKENANTISFARTCLYQDKIIAFLLFRRPSEGGAGEALARTIARIDKMRVGIGSFCETMSADVALRTSLMALDETTASTPRLIWDEMGMVAFEKILQADRLFLNLAQGYARRILNYDRQHNSDLLRTALAFSRNRGSIVKTAKLIHIHENTVRYRLKKLCELLGVDDTDFTNLFGLTLLIELSGFRSH